MAEIRNYEFMRPIAQGWIDKIGAAITAKKAFSAVGKQCEQFFSGDLGFMWKDDFRRNYMDGNIAPKFKVTLNKAFELVALVGPVLYWKYPQRTVKNYERLELSPELFGDPQEEITQQIFQQVMQQQQSEEVTNTTRNSLMSKYLNYSQREQPGGGLARHSELAITEALVKGRGCLWVEKYRFPGSGRTLTGCFYDSVDNLFIDPDSEDPTLSDAMWIARRHVWPTYKVERHFNLPKGSLEGRGSLESADSRSSKQSDADKMHRTHGKTFDLMVWYEVYSRGGAGSRMSGVHTSLNDAFDKVVGDYAYICVSDGVDYPLNAPSTKIRNARDEDVKKAFEWPVPYWRDDRFPVALLDFYRRPGSPWPIAPMSTGLGELMFLNVMISLLCSRVYSSTRDIIAYLKSAAQNVESELKSGNYQCFIEINDSAHKSINDMVQFLKQPEVNFDIFRMIEIVSDMFDKRVGLTDLLYGMNPGGVQSRTAADINVKQEMTSVRPEYMAGKVEEWQGEAANLEKFAARWNVTGRDIRPLMGQVGSHLWDQLIANEDPELVVREMKATVEAGSARKPNKNRDHANLQNMSQYMLAELSKHADITGDTAALNGFIKALGETMDQDVSEWEMGPRQQSPPDPQVMELQQQQQQMEMGKAQAELQGKQLDVDIKSIELAIKQAESQKDAGDSQIELAKKQLDLEFENERRIAELEHADDKHIQDLEHAEDSHEQSMDIKDEMTELEFEKAREEARIKLGALKQQSNRKHDYGLRSED